MCGAIFGMLLNQGMLGARTEFSNLALQLVVMSSWGFVRGGIHTS